MTWFEILVLVGFCTIGYWLIVLIKGIDACEKSIDMVYDRLNEVFPQDNE